MQTLRYILLYVLAAVVVVILGGLVGWYFFLYTPQQKEDAINTARGLDASTEFVGGSTQKNISTVIANQFSGTGPNDTTFATTSAQTATSSIATSTSPLWQIDKTPVAGMGFVKGSTSTEFLFVERANGYVFRADFKEKTVDRLTETLMPKIYEAFITIDGAIIQRSLDENGDITTFVGTMSASTTKATSSPVQTNPSKVLKGKYIAKNILQIALNPTARSMFYIARNDNGGVDGYTGWTTTPKKIFSSSIVHWIPQWLSDGRLIITEGAVDDLPGFSYSVSTNGTMSLLIGNVPGLTFLPHTNSKALLYGSSAKGSLTLFTQGVSSTTPTELTLKTVADKCVWMNSRVPTAYCAVPTDAPAGAFLNAWYRGAVHTSDEWWKIDIQSGVTQKIYSPKTSDNVTIDVERPMIDPTGNYITFINAADKSLWVLKIPQ